MIIMEENTAYEDINSINMLVWKEEEKEYKACSIIPGFEMEERRREEKKEEKGCWGLFWSMIHGRRSKIQQSRVDF